MSIELRFVCAMLAVWRLTHLFTAEDGPGDVVVHLRVRLGDSLAGRAMDCFYCLSMWIAAPIALYVAATDVISWGVTWLALSAGACLLERLTNRDANANGSTPVSRSDDALPVMLTPPPGTPSDEHSVGEASLHKILRLRE